MTTHCNLQPLNATSSMTAANQPQDRNGSSCACAQHCSGGPSTSTRCTWYGGKLTLALSYPIQQMYPWTRSSRHFLRGSQAQKELLLQPQTDPTWQSSSQSANIVLQLHISGHCLQSEPDDCASSQRGPKPWLTALIAWLELVLGVALTVIDLVGDLGNPRDNGS